MFKLPEADLPHPAWCAGEPHCTAFTQPPDGTGFHRSAPARIEAQMYGEPDITLAIRADTNDPIEQATPTLLLTFDTHGLVPHARGYELEARQAIELLRALQPLAAILTDPGR